MRVLVTCVCLLLALAASALGAPAHDGASLASLDCCHQVSAACTRLKARPRCAVVCHREPSFREICREVCPGAACHREPAFCDIDCPPCIEPPCHREAVTLYPAECVE